MQMASKLEVAGLEKTRAVLPRRGGREEEFSTPRRAHDGEDAQRLLGVGRVFALCSPSQLNMNFLFLKCDGGRSFFGRHKAVYPSFVGSHRDDGWIVGPTFKSYGLAITSIGNAYRGNGFR